MSRQEVKTALPKRSWRNYLLDPRFQLGWAARAAASTGLITLVLGYLLYRTVADATQQFLASQLSNLNLTPEVLAELVARTEQEKTAVLVTLIATLASVVVLMVTMTIIVTHRVAGPMYKLRRIFSSIEDEQLTVGAKLRKGDEMQSVLDEFSAMIDRLRTARERDLEILESLSGEPVSTDRRSDLDSMISRYRKSLGR